MVKLNAVSCLPSRHRLASSHCFTPTTSTNLILVTGMRGLPPLLLGTIYFPINCAVQDHRKITGISALLLKTKPHNMQGMWSQVAVKHSYHSTEKNYFPLSLKHILSLLGTRWNLCDSLPFTFVVTYTATLLQIHRKDKMLSNSKMRKLVSFF